MACSFVTTDHDDISELESFLQAQRIPSQIYDNTIQLERGGIIIKTAIGNIQYGMPPETVKDAINQELDIPVYYIIPKDRFDKKYGINVAEFEFPAYFNFFVKKRQVNLICTEEAEKAIRIVFQETLLGPASHPNLDQDFTLDYGKEKYPQFRKENEIFSKNENDPNDKGLTVDTLLSFIKYDKETNIALIESGNNKLEIKNEDGQITIYQNGQVIEKIKDQIKLTESNIQNLVTNFDKDAQRHINEMHLIDYGQQDHQIRSAVLSDEEEEQKSMPTIPSQRKISKKGSLNLHNSDNSNTGNNFVNLSENKRGSITNHLRDIRGSEEGFNKFVWTKRGGITREMSYFSLLNEESNDSFSPPDFGITILGASHGFDPKGSTSGFIVWVYGKGIMVDPPPFASSYLKKMGLQTSVLIKAIVITHCHADHDAGAFHKVLEDTQIEIISTRTIMNSFLAKYSALSKISKEQLQVLFTFRPVIIGQTMNIYGAQFKFFYSLHTIPCIGFECKVEDKSLYFSADTFYNPSKLKELYEKDKLSYHRYQQLAFPDFESQSVILHEAGVPPIHTPQSVLSELPSHIKNKLYLIHIAEKDLQKDLGLKIVGMGLENTLIILPSDNQKNMETKKRLELLSNIDILQSLTIKSINWLLDSLIVEKYSPGEVVVQEGTIGDKFYIIQSGVARIYSEKKENPFERFFSDGDYFGESSLIHTKFKSKRAASVQAVTDLTLLSLERNDFWFVFGDGSDGPGKVIQKFYNLSSSRNDNVQKVIQKNSLLQDLSSSQKTQLEMILSLKQAEKGQIVWEKEKYVKFAILIKKGAFQFFDCDEDEELVPGYFVSETRAMINKDVHKTNLKCVNRGEYFVIYRADLIKFLKKNPGLNILFRDLIFFD